MHPIKFWLNLTYGLGGDVIWRITRWPPSWLSEQNNFSNSESLCHCDASHQVLAQSDLMVWEEMSFEEFGGHLGHQNGTILAILNLCHCDASHQVSAQSDLRLGRRCRFKNFKMATIAAILDIGTEQF